LSRSAINSWPAALAAGQGDPVHDELRLTWPACLVQAPSPPVLQCLQRLSAPAWDTLVQEAARHQLAALLAWRLQNGALAGAMAGAVPAATRERLRELQMASTVKALLHERELGLVLRALAGADVRPIVFKGAALAHTVYPSPACRPMGDIDLWVTRDEMPRAQRALEAAGYAWRDKERRPLALQAFGDGEVQMHGAGPGQGLVELHWGVFAGEWLKRAAAIDRDAIRRRAKPATLAGQPVLLMAPEDALIQLIAHVAVNHQMSVAALRGLVDILLLSEAGVSWDLVTERARAWRLATAAGLVLAWVDALFASPGARGAADALGVPAARRWWVERWMNPNAVLRLKPLRKSRLRLLYQLSLVDRPRDAARLLGRAAWPEDEWLMARYGRRDAATRLQHLAAAVSGTL
jgi:hypothetical protein